MSSLIVILHPTYMVFERELRWSWFAPIETSRNRPRSLEIRIAQRQTFFSRINSNRSLCETKSDNKLNFLLKRFQQKVSSNATCVKPEVLPPTSAELCITVYWSTYKYSSGWGKEIRCNHASGGWCEKGGQYIPVLTDKAAALKHLKTVRCNCTKGCSNRQRVQSKWSWVHWWMWSV